MCSDILPDIHAGIFSDVDADSVVDILFALDLFFSCIFFDSEFDVLSDIFSWMGADMFWIFMDIPSDTLSSILQEFPTYLAVHSDIISMLPALTFDLEWGLGKFNRMGYKDRL